MSADIIAQISAQASTTARGSENRLAQFIIDNATALTVAAGASAVTLAAAAPGTIAQYVLDTYKLQREGGTSNTDFEFQKDVDFLLIHVEGQAEALTTVALRHQVDVQLQDVSAAVPTWYSVNSASYEFGPPVSQSLIVGQAGALSSGANEVASLVGWYIARDIKAGDLIRGFVEALVGDQAGRKIVVTLYDCSPRKTAAP